MEQIGTPLELYDRPGNIFTAGFIGSPAMNFLPGIPRREGNNIHVRTESGVELPLPPYAGGKDGRKVIYGVRPEHLPLGEDGVPARVNAVEPTGRTLSYSARSAATPSARHSRNATPSGRTK